MKFNYDTKLIKGVGCEESANGTLPNTLLLQVSGCKTSEQLVNSIRMCLKKRFQNYTATVLKHNVVAITVGGVLGQSVVYGEYDDNIRPTS